MRLNTLKIKFFILLSVLLLTGCASLQSIGDSALGAAGLGSETTEADASGSMITAAKNMSREEEYYLGRAVAARILEAYKPYNNSRVQDYVNLVGATVASFSTLPDTFGGYHFMVLDSDEVNAMAAPGGFIFVTRGMLDLMPDEDALASVLAHEVVHIEKRHGIEAISQSDLADTISALGKVAGSLNCGELITQASVVFGGAVDDVFNSLVVNGYSRSQEFEADAGAIQILNHSGYNPHSILVMLDQVEQAEAGGEGGWFDTHPETSDRVKKVSRVLKTENIPVNETGRVTRAKRFDKAVRQNSA